MHPITERCIQLSSAKSDKLNQLKSMHYIYISAAGSMRIAQIQSEYVYHSIQE